MRYELYYWPSSQGRGEYVRLALEEAGADYVDVARRRGGEDRMIRLMEGRAIKTPPFAPPYLRAGKLWIAQTAAILLYLGGRHGLAPRDEGGRLWAHQLQLTIADLVHELHNTHHPISVNLNHVDQIPESRRFAADFTRHRIPKFLGYFERALQSNRAGRGEHLIGARTSYPDLSLFQTVAALRFGFPNAMRRIERECPRVAALHDRVAGRPRISAYLESERRLPFIADAGVFRHYGYLDAK